MIGCLIHSDSYITNFYKQIKEYQEQQERKRELSAQEEKQQLAKLREEMAKQAVHDRER